MSKNHVLIGSKAMKYHFNDFNREPKDIDYIVKERKIKGSDSISLPFFVDYCKSEIASPNELLTLKCSHIFWNELGERNWEKHMWDIQFLLKKGAKYDWEMILKLKEFWTKHYGKLASRRSNLTLNSKDFFNNAINKNIDHDSIHLIINPEPTYKKVLKDNAEVEPCSIKYNNLSNEEKDNLFIEEVMVMAYERFSNLYYKKAYYIMCNKYIRSHMPLFCFDYVIKNYIRLSYAPYNFIKKIQYLFLFFQGFFFEAFFCAGHVFESL